MAELLSAGKLSELIGAIYDCALDPERWEATLEAIRDVFNGHNAQIFLTENLGGHLLIAKSVGIDPVWLDRQRLHDEETARWPLLPEVLALPVDEPQVASRHAPKTHWASRYFNEWAKPQGMFDSMNLSLINTVTNYAGIGIGRLRKAGLFSEEDMDLARLLSPHLRRAVTISNILEAKALELDSMTATFDELRFGVVLVDERCAILRSNSVAERMLQARVPIASIDGTLQAGRQAATTELQAAIRLAAKDEAAIGKTGLAVRLTLQGETPLMAHVLPIRRRSGRINAAAAVFVGGVVGKGADAMAIAYDLTPSETRLLDFLLAGSTLGGAAALLGISQNTAKTHLRHVFSKTGASRQADLVRLAAQVASPAGAI